MAADREGSRRGTRAGNRDPSGRRPAVRPRCPAGAREHRVGAGVDGRIPGRDRRLHRLDLADRRLGRLRRTADRHPRRGDARGPDRRRPAGQAERTDPDAGDIARGPGGVRRRFRRGRPDTVVFRRRRGPDRAAGRDLARHGLHRSHARRHRADRPSRRTGARPGRRRGDRPGRFQRDVLGRAGRRQRTTHTRPYR